MSSASTQPPSPDPLLDGLNPQPSGPAPRSPPLPSATPTSNGADRILAPAVPPPAASEQPPAPNLLQAPCNLDKQPPRVDLHSPSQHSPVPASDVADRNHAVVVPLPAANEQPPASILLQAPLPPGLHPRLPSLHSASRTSDGTAQIPAGVAARPAENERPPAAILVQAPLPSPEHRSLAVPSATATSNGAARTPGAVVRPADVSEELPSSNLLRAPPLPSLDACSPAIPCAISTFSVADRNPTVVPRPPENELPPASNLLQHPPLPIYDDPAMEYFKNTLPNALSLPGMPVSAEVPNFLQSLKPDPEISIYTSSGYAPAYTALPAPLLRNVKQEDVLCDTAMQPVLPSVPMLPRDPMLPSEAMPPPQPLLPSDPMPEVFVRTAYGYVPCALPVPNLSMSVKPEDVLPGSMPSGFPELGLPTDPKTPEQQMQARRRWKRKVILAEKRKFRKMMDDMSFRKPVAMKRRQPSKKKDGPAKKTASGVKKRRKPKKKKVVVKLVPEEELIASPTTKKTPAEPPCEPVETKPDVHSKNASGDANCNKRGSSSLDSNLHLASYPVKLHLSLKRKQSRHPGTPAKKTKTAIPRVRTATNSTLNTESAPDKGLTAKAPSKKTALLKMSGNKGSSTIRDSGNKETPKPTKKPKAKAKSKSSKKPIETLPASHVPANAEDEVAVSAGASNASKEKAVTENPINPSSSGHPSSAILGAVAAVSTATPVEKSAAKSGKKTGTKKAPVRKAPAKKAKSGSKTAPKPKPNTGEEVHASAGPSKASKEKVATETPIIPNSSGNPSSAVPEHIASNSTVAPIEKLPAKTATKKATARKPPAKTGKSGSATTPKPKRSAKTQTGKVSKAKATSKKAASQVLPSKNAKSVNPAKSAPKKPKSNPKTQKKACSSDAAAGNSALTKPNGFSSSAKESAVNAPPQEATVSKAFVRDAKGPFAKSKSNVDVNKELDRVLDANFDSLASGGKTSLAKPLNANAFVVETGTKKTDEEGNANVEADSSARAIGTIDSSATTKKHPVEAWHGNPSEVFASAKEAPAATKKDISSPTGADKEKICELEREVAALKWALVRSNARDEVNLEVTQVTFKSADMGEKFANQSIETAKIAQGWSKAAGTFPPWEIRANISSSAQTRSQLSLQSVYLHVEDCIRSGSAPPCILSLRELRNGILSILKTSSKADFANTPLHATVAFAMSKMTQSFLNGVFSALLMSPSKVDMSWSTTVVTHIIEPILRFSASESRAIFADVSKSCTTAICDSANSLSTEPQLLPHVQVEKSVRAIELATAIVSTKEKSILSQVPEHNVNTIGARNVLFLIRFASVN